MSPPVPPPAPRSWNALTAPGTFTEGDSLRRVENLPQFTPNLQPRDIAFIKYSTSRNHNEETEQSDNCGEEYSIGKIADLDHLGPEDFPPEKDFTPTPDTDKLVRVIYAKGCYRDTANKFVAALRNSEQLPSFVPIPGGSPSLERNGDFVTGISMTASSDPKNVALLVAFPYLGAKPPPGSVESPDSRTLSQFRLRHTTRTQSSGSWDSEIRVYEAWFFLFDNTRIAVFKSKDDMFSDRAPLFLYQTRLGAAHALVQMAANIFGPSEKMPLFKFRNAVTEMVDMIIAPDGTPFERERLDQAIVDLTSMRTVARRQIEILRDLQQLFGNLGRKQDRPQYGNALQIPFLEEQPEQIKAVDKLLVVLVKEREELDEELAVWAADLTALRNLNSQSSQLATAEALSTSMKDQLGVAKGMAESLKQQGQTISVFTFLTTAFLPLNFLSSYFGMNPAKWKGSIGSNYDFWKVSGPTVGVLLLLMSLFLFCNDGKIKKWIFKQLDKVKKWITEQFVKVKSTWNNPGPSTQPGAASGGTQTPAAPNGAPVTSPPPVPYLVARSVAPPQTTIQRRPTR